MIQNPDIRKEEKKGKKEIIMIKDPIKAIGLKKAKGRIKETRILHPATKVIDISAKQIMQRIEIIKTPIRAPPDS